jgi:23S rRNA pseudouridine1911/1915/1917 synthase
MDATKVLYEDNHIIAINKSVSDIVQGDKTGDEPLSEKVKSYLKTKYQKPGNVFVGVTHRLDRPTSGVVLFARTSKALTRLNAMFQEKTQIQKTYWAIVKNRPEQDSGRLVHLLLRDTQKNKSTVVKKPVKEAKEAILEYEVVAQSDNFYLLQINLLTGRHHQIRAQLAAIGCPIKGDLKYGFPRSNPDGGISLHARSIEFAHPVSKERIKIIASVPDDKLWHYFEEASHSK